MNEPKEKIEAWYMDGLNQVRGLIADGPRKGKYIQTSPVKSKGVNTVFTESGSMYELVGDPHEDMQPLETIARLHAIPYRPRQ